MLPFYEGYLAGQRGLDRVKRGVPHRAAWESPYRLGTGERAAWFMGLELWSDDTLAQLDVVPR